ncbi:pilus assembly protein N-terminal domain-containing protein [Aquabacter spiritensis]|uniref:Putative type II/III system pilus formation protein n=1 Tax=Aquabacter spiritensis TaxID=933073 RepID=A0A4R3M840_9HYPH|nr:pilus assembly protein N-terminal domain-containing protein [Aquabacter spiritensis]TCT07505.1 putative type II/III system pilus formation protein [Aquabacter spiritensis]
MALAGALLLAVPAATPAVQAEPVPALTGAVAVTLDAAAIFSLPSEAEIVIVGNPAIADVSKPPKSANFVVVTGKSFGQTNIILMDKAGLQIAAADVRVVPPSAATVTVQRGTDSRVTYSCAPVCVQAFTLGDSMEASQALAGQIQQRQIIALPPQPAGTVLPPYPAPGAALPSVGNVIGAGVFGPR